MEENKDAATPAPIVKEQRESDDSTDKDSAMKNAAKSEDLQRKRQVKEINKLAEERALAKKRVQLDEGLTLPEHTITTKEQFERFLKWIEDRPSSEQ